MLKATVDEAATTFDVTTKTIREWIRQGMPVHQRGEKGSGNGAVIDMARAPSWVANHQEFQPRPMAEFFNKHHPDRPNPFRAVVELFYECSVYALAVAAERWFTEPDTSGQLRWKELGLTEEQAKAIVWEWWAFGGLFLLTAKLDKFDEWVARDLMKGADLDDLASLFLGGDIRSEWKDELETPDLIKKYMPEHIRKARRLRSK